MTFHVEPAAKMAWKFLFLAFSHKEKNLPSRERANSKNVAYKLNVIF